MLNGLQPWHLIILVLVVVLLFGAKRLPDAARSVGKSMKIFRAETKSMGDTGDGSTQEPGSGTAEAAEPKQLTESSGAEGRAASAGTADTQAEQDKDEQIRQLQKQLDELKQQPSENAQR